MGATGLRESATESRPPIGGNSKARVKGCGKSAPGPWQQGSHGKPHPEQDRIGAARSQEQACFAPAARVGRLSVAAMRRLEEWLPRPIRCLLAYRRPDRTRLTGSLAFHSDGPAAVSGASDYAQAWRTSLMGRTKFVTLSCIESRRLRMGIGCHAYNRSNERNNERHNSGW